jgi:hypothetical protein
MTAFLLPARLLQCLRLADFRRIAPRLGGEAGCLFDATMSRVEQAERQIREGVVRSGMPGEANLKIFLTGGQIVRLL